MNVNRKLSGLAGVAIIIPLLTGCGGGDVKQLQSENEALRTEIAALQARSAEADAARNAELKRQESDASDVARLRGEVTQLRNTAKDAEKLRAENQQLRNENQQLRSRPTVAAESPAPTTPTTGTFPRDSWKFAGYTSPENALISAIYSMQQGYTKEYFNSLTPDEQARMAKLWEGKPQEEIAAKHAADTAAITGIQVLNQQAISADEVQMNVHIGGVGRNETVSVKRIGADWKFNGFIREAKP